MRRFASRSIDDDTANYAGDLHDLLEERLEEAKRLLSTRPRGRSRHRLFHERAWIAHSEVRALREPFGSGSAANDLYDLGFALREAAERSKRDYLRATRSQHLAAELEARHARHMARSTPEDGLPEDNNCHGQLTAPSGLAVVAELFVGPGWSTRRRVSGYTGFEELALEGPGLELETDPYDGHRHLIGGSVEPSERGRASLRHVSVLLGGAGIAHRLELYASETDELLDYHEYGWSDEVW